MWTFLGGEEGVIIAGILAGEGYLNLLGIILASALGGSLGDQVYFYMAYRHGERLLKRSDRLAQAYPKAERLVQKYGRAIVLISRFLLGLRIAIPVVCGTFKMRALSYSVLNLVSALLWASLYGTLAYHFGRVLWVGMKKLPPALVWGIGLLLGSGFIIIFWLHRSQRRARPTPRFTGRGNGDE